MRDSCTPKEFNKAIMVECRSETTPPTPVNRLTRCAQQSTAGCVHVGLIAAPSLVGHRLLTAHCTFEELAELLHHVAPRTAIEPNP